MARSKETGAGGVADENGEVVQRFSMTMHNLGLARAAEELVAMLKSERWLEWSQGGMTFRFLPGEFDYFLSQQDIQREDVMAIPDLQAKAQLEAAMDERRTGEDGYRRAIKIARKELPKLPGRPARPYGYSRSEAEAIGKELSGKPAHRPALGATVRRYRNTGGADSGTRDKRPRWERLAASARRLPDEELAQLKQLIDDEHEARKRHPRG